MPRVFLRRCGRQHYCQGYEAGGQQRFQRVEVVAMDQHVPCVAVALRVARHFLK